MIFTNISNFEMLVYDSFFMDLPYPALEWKTKDIFKRDSYFRWAIKEIINQVKSQLSSDFEFPIDSYITILTKFKMRIIRNKQSSKEVNDIFEVLMSATDNVIDVLEAMK